MGNLPFEIIFVDGGSIDGSLQWMRERRDAGEIVLIEQGQRLGAVAAFNAGFSKARGEYTAAINDDAAYSSDELVRSCDLLDSHPDVGQVAIPFSLPNQTPHVDTVNLWGLKLCYANFSVIRTALGRKLDFWGQHYAYAGDTELSIKVWNSNLKVAYLLGGHIIHHQLKDDTRVPNVESRSLGVWNNSPVPAIILQMRKGLPKLPTSRNRKPGRLESPRRPNKSQRSKLLGVDGMSLVKYLGDGLVVKGTPSGVEYRFSGGACLYVDDRDLDYVFARARQGESLRVI